MIKIGITGGIGSGKTTVCRIFNTLGVPVYNSDLNAKILTDTDPTIIRQITELFGHDAYITRRDENGQTTILLNRGLISGMVFNNSYLLEALNKIIHPAVERDFMQWASRQSFHYVLQEAAILFESGADKKLDAIVTVTAPLALRIKRTMQRDGIDENTVRKRIDNQIDEQERILRADYIIEADDRHLIIPQILDLHNKFLQL